MLREDDPDPVVAWWRVEGRTLVLGRGSRVTPDEDACARAGVTVLRRGSGGGPVLWGPHLLALDVVVPRGHPLHTPDVTAAYAWLGRAIAAGLREAGVPDARAVAPTDARAMNDPDLAAASCFAGVSPWEVMVGDRKIAGLSQIRRRGAIALQAGILMEPESPVVTTLLVPDPDRPFAHARIAARAVDVAAVGGRGTDEVLDAIDRHVVRALAVDVH